MIKDSFTLIFRTIWGSSLILLLLGWYLPFISVNKFFIFSNEVSILSAIGQLWTNGDILLSILMSIASLILPMTKVVLLAMFHQSPSLTAHKWLHQLGKWSQTDVFIVSFMVVALKLKGLVEVSIGIGFYTFVSSALISYGLGHWLSYRSSSIHTNK